MLSESEKLLYFGGKKDFSKENVQKLFEIIPYMLTIKYTTTSL